jgi:hypothetical protein
MIFTHSNILCNSCLLFLVSVNLNFSIDLASLSALRKSGKFNYSPKFQPLHIYFF